MSGLSDTADRSPVAPLRAAAIAYVLVDALAKGSNLCVVLLATRALARSEVGTYAAIAMTVQFLSILLPLGLDHAAGRWFFGTTKEVFGRSLTTLLLLLVAWLTIAAAVLDALGRTQSARWLTTIPYVPLGQLAVMTAIPAAFVKVPQAVFVSARGVARVAAVTLAATVVPTLLAVTALLSHGNLRMVVMGQAFGAWIAAALALGLVAGQLRPGFAFAELKDGLRYGLPLMPATLGYLALELLDRYLLERLLGLEAVADYYVASLFGVAVFMVAGSLHQAWYPAYLSAMTELERRGEADRERVWRHIQQQARHVAGAAFAVGMLAMLWSDSALRLVLPASYSRAFTLAPLFVAAKMPHILYMFQVHLLYYKKATGIVGLIVGVAAVAGAVGIVWLVRVWGLVGAALGTGLALLVLLAAATIASRRYGRPPLSTRDLVMLIVIESACGALLYAIPESTHASARIAISAALSIAISIVLLRWEFLGDKYWLPRAWRHALSSVARGRGVNAGANYEPNRSDRESL